MRAFPDGDSSALVSRMLRCVNISTIRAAVRCCCGSSGMFDGEGMIMSLFQRIKSMLGLSEATVPPPASKPTPTPMAPKAVAPTAPAPAAAPVLPVEPAATPEPAAASPKPAPMSPEVKALLAKGRAHLKEENVAAAKESFDAILAIDPENEAALKLSGLSAARLKKAAHLAKKAAAAAAKG